METFLKSIINSGNNKKTPKDDDVLEGMLYPRFCYTLNAEEVTDAMLSEEIAKYNKDIEPFTKRYLWHRDSLTLRPRTKQSLQFENIIDGNMKPSELDLIPHIDITLRFDEDIGDEWFVVFLIYHLTKKYEGLIARVSDSDGEFLLIEAADELPVWATPESCQNRVFIMDGAVHVFNDKQKICINILNSVYQKSHIIRMSDKVQSVIKKRIDIYPEEIEKRSHKARAYLPEKAAYILSKHPDLVSAAIRTICHSDTLERKVCRAMCYFPPEQRQMANIKMTKCLYAMQANCKYTGDPRTGWNLPPANSPKYNAYVLGIKIACGLELLVARAHQENKRKIRETEVLENNDFDKFENHTWMTYLKRLEATGYFKGMYEESKEYQKLLEQAKEYFLQNMSGVQVSCRFEATEAEKVLDAWKGIQSNDIEVQAIDENCLSPEDSTSWMNVDPAHLESLLSQQFNLANATNSSSEAQTLTQKMEAFLSQESDYEGVEIFGQTEGEARENEDDNERVNFDPDTFDTALRDILDLVVPGEDGEFDGSSESSFGGDDDDGGSEMEEYMRLMDAQLKQELVKDKKSDMSDNKDVVETNLLSSLHAEAGGAGPAGNIIGGPLQRLKQLHLQSSNMGPSDDGN